MIVQCKRLYNRMTGEYHDGASDGFLTISALYCVLEIYFDTKGVDYRVFSDAPHYRDHPILVRSDDFEVLSGLMPDNWEVNTYPDGYKALSPRMWNIYEPWEESFWQDFDNDLPKARKCFDDEIKIIFATDPEYIKIIDQQQGREPYFK